MNFPNGKEVAAEGQDSDYKATDKDIKLEIASGSGSIAGEESGVYINHSQFYGRAKNFEFKTYKDLNQSVSLVEMHETTINLGEGAENHLTLSPNDFALTDLSGKKIRIVTKKLDSGESSATKTCTLTHKTTGAKYEIKVKVYDFVAKPYVVLRDNYGYKWETGDGESLGSSNGENVLVGADHAMALVGDTLAVATNSADFSMAWSDYNGSNLKNPSRTSTLTTQNYTTMKNKAKGTEEGYVVNDYVVNSSESSLEKCQVKYYKTSTTDDKQLKDTTNVKGTVSDDAISAYYKNSENTAEVNFEMHRCPGVWLITKQYYRQNCLGGACVNVSGLHKHIGSYAFPNAVYSHAAVYNKQGLNYTDSGSQKDVSGTYNDGGVSYLNVSELNKDSRGAKNILSWTGTETTYNTYKEMQFSGGTELPAGFASIYYDRAGNPSGDTYDGKYAYIRADNFFHDGRIGLFTVSYRVYGSDDWKYINSSGGTYIETKVKNDPSKYKNCLFAYTSGEDSHPFNLYYPTVKDDEDNDTSVDCVTHTTERESGKRKIAVVKYKATTNQSDSVYSEQAEIGDLGVIRLNCDTLGWLEPSVTYVDIRLTFVDPDSLNRSYAIPIRFYNKTKPNVTNDSTVYTE